MLQEKLIATTVLWGAVISLVAALFVRYFSTSLTWLRLTPALRRQYSRLPKGSLGWPVLGETLSLQQSLMSTSPHIFVTDRRRKYGSDMFLTHLFGTPLLASTSPEINKFILTNDEEFLTTLPKAMRMAVGENALLLTRGEKHKRLRRITFSLSSPDSLKSHGPYIQELACSCLQTWKGRKVIVEKEARDFTFFVMLELVLGMRRGERAECIRARFMELREGVRSLPFNLPGTSYRRAVKARKILKEIVEELISERKGSVEDQFSDLLGKLIRAKEEDGGENLNSDEIVDVILSTMLAGFDSTTNTLVFLIYYIGLNPGLRQDLKVEHRAILREKDCDDASALKWSHYKSMKLTLYAINETLRLSNPMLSLHRKAVHDFECNGTVVPAGCQLQVWLRTIHTDPKLYPQPYNFDIDRWKYAGATDGRGLMFENVRELYPSACIGRMTGKAITTNFYPFGVGPRLCVGMELARFQLSLFIHCLVTTYSWEMTENDVPNFYPAPRMRSGLPIVVKEL